MDAPQQKILFIIWRRKSPQQLWNLHFPQNFLRKHLGTFDVLGCHESTPEHGQHLHQTQKDEQEILVCKYALSVRTLCIRPKRILCSVVPCQIMHMV
jgi:hypothetical protein